MKKDSIGNRMKDNYESRYGIKLTRRMPVVLRLDGKSFHTLTRICAKPFDKAFQAAMQHTALELCSQIQGAKCAYVQSDEISILLTDFDRLTTDAWFDYNLQKIVSISAGIASACFSYYWSQDNYAVFDSRAFNLPKEEVCNYFIWRQQDWIRNSIQMLSQNYYSHKQLHKKNTADMHEMLHEKEVNWADLDSVWKNGIFLFAANGEGWKANPGIIFTKDRQALEQYIVPIEE